MVSHVVVIGASAGGVAALQRVVAGLPLDLPAAVVAVLHIAPHGHSELVDVLQRNTNLMVSWAESGAPLERGRIFVAPPDRHVLVVGERLLVTEGPAEHRVRPAIDMLFRSAAYSQRARVIGVLLTGALDDGAAGLWTIKHTGGTVVVQDPSDAVQATMPRNALRHVTADHVRPLAEIAGLIQQLTQQPEGESVGRARGPVASDLAKSSGLGALMSSLERDVDSSLASALRILEDKLLLLGQLALAVDPQAEPVLRNHAAVVERQIEMLQAAIEHARSLERDHDTDRGKMLHEHWQALNPRAKLGRDAQEEEA